MSNSRSKIKFPSYLPLTSTDETASDTQVPPEDVRGHRSSVTQVWTLTTRPPGLILLFTWEQETTQACRKWITT
jgi:hypothetical protein